MKQQFSPLFGIAFAPLFQHLTAYLTPPLLPPSGQSWEEEVLAEAVFSVILTDGKLVRERRRLLSKTAFSQRLRGEHMFQIPQAFDVKHGHNLNHH